jgi:hypothetical protein
MKKINLLLLISSATLVACNHREREPALDSEPAVKAPLPPHAPINPLAPVGQPVNIESNVVIPQIQEPAIIIPEKVPGEQQAEWHPKEGDLVRAGEFIMKLKREKGSSPTNKEMASYLQNSMAISPSQAHLILEELGLE